MARDIGTEIEVEVDRRVNEMAAPLVFQREWSVEIKEMFKDDDDHSLPSMAATLRVPAPLLEMKPEAFIPRLLSLGPYHHSKLEKFIDSPCAELKISMVERHKVKSVGTLSQKLSESRKNFEGIVEIINRLRPRIESFYGLPSSTESEYCKNFPLMMAIDSSFLLQFLNMLFPLSISTLALGLAKESFFASYFECIKHDIVKLENQIPLFVLREVLAYVKETEDNEIHPTNDIGSYSWEDMCWETSPFTYHIGRRIPPKLIGEMGIEPHILGCIHTCVSQVLNMQCGCERQKRQKGLMGTVMHKFNGILNEHFRHFLPAVADHAVHFSQGMSARQLVTAGIKFKSFTKFPDSIELDKDSGTLYLPEIRLNGIGTEVWLRNMLALEFNDDKRRNFVTRYVCLMGYLVQSPDDVRILVDRHVISPSLFHSTDECTAKMWRDLSQPFLVGGVTEVHAELYEALQEWSKRSYWKNKIKRKVCRLYDFVLSWKFVAPVAAFLGLLMTAIQTYCSFHHCSRER